MNQPPLAPHDSPSLSGWQALWRVLTSPRESFERLGERPPILPAYAFQMVVAALAFILTLKTVIPVMEMAMTQAAQQNPGALPPNFFTTMKWVFLAFAGSFSLAVPWIVGLLVALIALFVEKFTGGDAPFSAYFGMAGYAHVPTAIAALLGGVWTAATGKTLNLSLSVFASPESSNQLRALLSAVNPFAIWYYILLAIGFATLLRRPSARGWPLPVTIFLLSTLLSLGMSGLAPQNVPMP